MIDDQRRKSQSELLREKFFGKGEENISTYKPTNEISKSDHVDSPTLQIINPEGRSAGIKHATLETSIFEDTLEIIGISYIANIKADDLFGLMDLISNRKIMKMALGDNKGINVTHIEVFREADLHIR